MLEVEGEEEEGEEEDIVLFSFQSSVKGQRKGKTKQSKKIRYCRKPGRK